MRQIRRVPLVLTEIVLSSEYNSKSETSTSFSFLLSYTFSPPILLLLSLLLSPINSPLLYNNMS